MYLCIFNRDGEILVHRNMAAGPEPFLKTIAPYRTELVVGVECLLTWCGLADLCAREGMPLVLGHALSMKAIHGSKAKHDKLDAPNIAVRLRGGMLPSASVSPAEMRVACTLLPRRLRLTRQCAARLTHVQQTTWPDNRPELGPKIADQANHHGVAARIPDPAVHKGVEVDLALIDYSDQ
jgi:hypothetical protein